MKLPSNQQHRFAEVPEANIERSAFDRTHTHKTTFEPDYLIPFYVDEVLPGDTFSLDCTNFVRMMSPLTVPVMDNMYFDTFFFHVPLRLLWTNFPKFMGEQANPGDSVSFTTPQIVADAGTGFTVQSLSDYMGLPIGVNSLSVCSFWHRAYNLIWNTWFRDQNLQNSVVVDQDDGPDVITDYVLLKRGKRHDYFTSALPFAQKGTAVSIGLSGTAPVLGIGKLNQNFVQTNQTRYESDGTTTVYATSSEIGDSALDNGYGIQQGITGTGGTTGYPWIRADLSSGTATTINALRLAFQTQKMLERDARGGTRYIELVKSHFQVSSPDLRAVRPVFLGGHSTGLQIQTVAQTSSSDTQPTPQANLSAFAAGTNMRDGFTHSFTEHGVVIGLCMVRADLTYQKSLDKMFTRSTRLDFYWPALSHLGEQAVLNKEIYCDGSANDNLVFGYQERYAEYRYARSKITGKLNSHAATPLDMWHLAQKFTSLPTLSPTFITETMPVARIEAVTTEPAFVMDSFIKIRAVRPMPVYAIPGLIDHF